MSRRLHLLMAGVCPTTLRRHVCPHGTYAGLRTHPTGMLSRRNALRRSCRPSWLGSHSIPRSCQLDNAINPRAGGLGAAGTCTDGACRMAIGAATSMPIGVRMQRLLMLEIGHRVPRASRASLLVHAGALAMRRRGPWLAVIR